MQKALVTGGGGFLGGAIARLLASEGWAVRSYSRGRYPLLEQAGIECVQGDLADAGALLKACEGQDAVFHAAAKVGLWGDFEDFHRSNVKGTENVLEACRKAGVGRLIFTSSPSVVFDGSDVDGWDESAPYPARYDSFYSRTKAEAEALVLSADGPGLRTVALRPHLVWGPPPNHIVDRIVAQGRGGKLRRVGDFNELVDTTWVDDAAKAHLLAAANLANGASAGGKAYFISSGDPQPVWDVVNGILAAASLPPVTRSVSKPAADTAASLLEGAWRLLRLRTEPRLTRFLVSQLTTAHWFDIGAARRDLGYRPQVGTREALARLKESFRIRT